MEPVGGGVQTGQNNMFDFSGPPKQRREGGNACGKIVSLFVGRRKSEGLASPVYSSKCVCNSGSASCGIYHKRSQPFSFVVISFQLVVVVCNFRN